MGRISVGIDVGGTFTDLIAVDESSGDVICAKSQTTPKNFVAGVMSCIQKSAIDPSDISLVVHGTTVCTNVIVERKGARVGLLATEGFIDTLEIRRLWREKLYDQFWSRPETLVPRYLRRGIQERINWRGEVIEPLDENQARGQIQYLVSQGIESFCVSLLFSFLNDRHEKRIRELIHEINPAVNVSLSCEVLPEIREYERTSTTTISALISPVIEKYITDLQNELASQRIRTPLKIIKSNGGVMTAKAASAKSVEMFESGPAGGIVASQRLGKALGCENIITLDMGGTTTDVGIIHRGEPLYTMEKDIEWNIPIRVPMFDISSIGSGGGSIAWIDKGGALNVGPQSAGADPGPVCYGKGGLEPTITDANIILGRLNPDNFLGGEMTLDKPAAERAIQEKIAVPYGWDVLTSSLAIFKIACANMGHLLNERTVMCGLDPRDFSMVTFGGSGALFAGKLAAEIGIPRVIVPFYPALFSALGCLLADTKYDYVRSYFEDARKIKMEKLNSLCQQLMEDSNRDLLLEDASAGVEYHYSIDLRYVGEFFEITVPLDFEGTCTRNELEASIEKFHKEHERRYEFRRPYQPVEIVSLRLSALIPTQRKELLQPSSLKNSGNGKSKTTRDVFFEECAGFVSTPIFDRESLPVSTSIEGPAIIEEPTCTTVLVPGQKGSVDEYRNIVIGKT